MIRPATKHFFEFTAGVLAVVVLLAGFLMWQLSQGPVSLNVISPNIRDALNANRDGPEIDFKDVTLRWSQRQSAIDVAVSEVSVTTQDGEEIATIPEVFLRFSMGAILRGMVAPSRVEILGASALLVRGENGAFELGLAAKGDTAVTTEDLDIENPDESGLLTSMLQSIAGPNDRSTTIGYLNDLILTDGSLTFRDGKNDAVWQAKGATITFQRTEQGATGLLNASIEGKGGPVDVMVSGDFNRQTQEARVEAEFSEVMLSQFAAESTQLAVLKRLQMPVQGSFSVRVTPSGQLRGFGAKIAAAQGFVDLTGIKLKDDTIDPEEEAKLPEWARIGEYADEHIEAPPLGKIRLDEFIFDGSWNETASRLEMRQLVVKGLDLDVNLSGSASLTWSEGVDGPLEQVAVILQGKHNSFFVDGILGEPLVLDEINLAADADLKERKLTLDNLSFAAYGASGFFKGEMLDGVNDEGNFAPGVHMTGRVRDMAARDLIKFWPVIAGLAGRDWIRENLKKGRLTRAEFKMDLEPGELSGGLPNEAMRVDFAFEGGVADYLPGLTLLRDAKGSGTVYGNSLRISVPTGKVGNLVLTEGDVYIPRLSPKGAIAEFSATVEGQSSEILELIDMEPLKLTRRTGLDPQSVGGKAKVYFKVGRPMHRKVPPDLVTYTATAQLSGLTLPNIFGELSFANGALKLDVDNKGIKGAGTVDLATVPVHIVWREQFNTGTKPSTVYEVTVDADADDYIKLGYPLGAIFDGPIHTVIRTSGRGMDVDSSQIEADFSKAAVDLSLFHYSKDINLPGRAKFTFRMDDQDVRYFKNIRFTGDRLDVSGNMTLGGDYRLLEASFPQFLMGDDMDFVLKASRVQAEDRLVIDVSGPKFDAGSLVLDYLMGEGESSEAALTLSGDVGRMRLNNDVFLDDVTMALATDGLELTALHLEGGLPNGGGMFASLGDLQFGRRHLLLSSSDAGAVLGGFYDVASVVGGEFDLSAHIEPIRASEKSGKKASGEKTIDQGSSIQASPAGSVMFGKITIIDFKVVDLPLLARLLSAAGSLSGLGDLLGGSGLTFKDIEIPFVMNPATVELSDVRAAGPSMGVTMNGVYDREVEEIDFRGTLVPAYSVNRIFGYVPFIGDLFISKKGEGLLGFTYRVSGPLDEARVFVNPLSGLAPGFLRRLFQLGGKKVAAPPDPSTLPENGFDEGLSNESAGKLDYPDDRPEDNFSGPIMPLRKPEYVPSP